MEGRVDGVLARVRVNVEGLTELGTSMELTLAPQRRWAEVVSDALGVGSAFGDLVDSPDTGGLASGGPRADATLARMTEAPVGEPAFDREALGLHPDELSPRAISYVCPSQGWVIPRARVEPPGVSLTWSRWLEVRERWQAEPAHVARVPSLDVDLGSGLGEPEPDLEAVLRSLEIAPARVRDLRLSCADLTKRQLEALLASPAMDHLRTLALNRCGLDARGAEQIATSPRLRALEALDLSENRVGAGAAALVADGNLPALQRLGLFDCRLRPKHAESFARAWRRPNVETLGLSFNAQLGDEGLAALAQAPGLAGATTLLLARCGLGSAGVAALARSPLSAAIERLDVSYARLGEQGCAELMAQGALPRLRELSLERTRLRTASIDAIGARLQRSPLDALNLHFNHLGEAAMKRLRAWPPGSLRRLDVGSNKLSYSALRHLSAWPGLSTLEELRAATAIHGRNAGHLVERALSRGLPRLVIDGSTYLSSALYSGVDKSLAEYRRLGRLVVDGA